MNVISEFIKYFNTINKSTKSNFSNYYTYKFKFAGITCYVDKYSLGNTNNWADLLNIIVAKMVAPNSSDFPIIIKINEQTNLDMLTVPSCVIKVAKKTILTTPIQCVLVSSTCINRPAFKYLEFEALYVDNKNNNYATTKVIKCSRISHVHTSNNINATYLFLERVVAINTDIYIKNFDGLCVIDEDRIYINNEHELCSEMTDFIAGYINKVGMVEKHYNCYSYRIKNAYELFINANVHNTCRLLKNARK